MRWGAACTSPEHGSSTGGNAIGATNRECASSATRRHMHSLRAHNTPGATSSASRARLGMKFWRVSLGAWGVL
jgi:hypothetical protein